MTATRKSPAIARRDRVAVPVVTRFILGSASLVALVALVATFEGWRGLSEATASTVARVAAALGIGAWASGDTVVLSSRALVIDLNCTGIYLIAMYTALVMAYPVDPRTRILGALVGIPCILAANVLRLVMAAQISESLPAFFDVSHDYLYQVGLVLIVALAWLAWLSYARAHAR